MDKEQLRKQLRQQRQLRPPLKQQHCAQQILTHCVSLPAYQAASHLGFYWENDGELNPHFILEDALARQKTCYLPIIDPRNEERLCFMPYTMSTPLIKNRYGILEPAFLENAARLACELQLIFLPLVGFDDAGHRLGMGGGFYDKTLAKIKSMPQQSTLLLGLAYEDQHIEKLPTDPWDVPLDGIITEKKFHPVKN